MRDKDHVHKPFSRPGVEFDELVECISCTVVFRRDRIVALLINIRIGFVRKPLAFAIYIDAKRAGGFHRPTAEIPDIDQPLIGRRECRSGACAAEHGLAPNRIRFQREWKTLDFNGAKRRHLADTHGHLYDIIMGVLFLDGDFQSRPFAGF